MTNYTTNSFVKDSNYSTLPSVAVKNSIIECWLLTSKGEILIKPLTRTYSTEDILEISDVTLQTSNIPQMLKEIEANWGIVCKDENMQHIYSSCSSVWNDQITVTDGYVLSFDFSEDEIDLILEKSGSNFYNYKDLEDVFNSFNKSMNFKESYYSLILELYKKFA
jgi:hypothetical protein